MNQSPLAPMVRKLELWANFTDVEREALLALPYVLQSLAPNQAIINEGDRATHSCLLRSGFAYRQKIVRTGARQILAVHMAGDMVDLQNSLLRIADHGVLALTPAEVAFIPREAVLDLAFKHRTIGEALWFDTLVDGSLFRERIVGIGRRDGATRIAHLLCEFGLRLEVAGLGSHHEYELPMTQEELGDCLGLTPVHVNRMLRILSDEALIERKQRAVRIVDWAGLVRRGDFDGSYLHMRSECARLWNPAS
ncbi:Crp/Fnr family transcriptional regulator [Sphingomonas sp. S1-29]|uniref:Crp/Fnr family transcriptional regulator n=1 Tax=Sphingomonas sp. S1-29 TaxID=2991074 RepID=UPI00223EC840|nr:Crp/Fnr family transcriptional regulator [Sphingomonas sp. S1-29]UZK69633.1 Crp/Fnr family transcriptional regulator [Sphingomonas sp. S1-29]